MDSHGLGSCFDSPDDLFKRFHTTILAMAVSNALNRSGVVATLIDGPASVQQLAAISNMPAEKLSRLLDFFLAHEIITQDADGVLSANQRTHTLHDAAGYLETCELAAAAGSKLMPALQRGDTTPFEEHFEQPVFEYFTANPDKAASFGSMMGWMTARVEKFIFSQHRFHPFGTIVDIGGNMGDLLLAILSEYPDSKGILFDLPDVVARAMPVVAASSMAGRVECVGGSFFGKVPSADLYTLKQILHDWHDDECRQILGSIRAAINPGGRVAVIDHILSDSPTPDEAQGTDISMMIWDTGRERRFADFEALFAATGFTIDRVTRNPAGHSVIEVVAA